jgi:hypothetical protein
LRADLAAKAIAAAKAVNYVGAGTVEFIFDNNTQEFYFMEMWECFVDLPFSIGIISTSPGTPGYKLNTL